jgi:hypothetical protein
MLITTKACSRFAVAVRHHRLEDAQGDHLFLLGIIGLAEKVVSRRGLHVGLAINISDVDHSVCGGEKRLPITDYAGLVDRLAATIRRNERKRRPVETDSPRLKIAAVKRGAIMHGG